MCRPRIWLTPAASLLWMPVRWRRRPTVARCLADVIHSHSGTKVFIEQEVLALTRAVNGQREHARMDLVFNHLMVLSHTCLDVSIVALFSCNPSLVAAASTRPGHMAKRADKSKFDRYPHMNIVQFILATTGRPGPHARKFNSNLMKDDDNSPLAIRDTWSAIQSVLHSAISKQQAHSRRYVTSVDRCHSQFYLCRPRYASCQYRPNGKAHSILSLKPTAAELCGPAPFR